MDTECCHRLVLHLLRCSSLLCRYGELLFLNVELDLYSYDNPQLVVMYILYVIDFNLLLNLLFLPFASYLCSFLKKKKTLGPHV